MSGVPNLPKHAPGILTINSTTNSAVINTVKKIPQQVLTLKVARVEYDTAAHALAARVIYVDVPWLSSNQLIDENIGRSYLPIPLDNAIVTLYKPDLPVYMSDEAHEVFDFRVYDSTFALASGGFAHISLQFSYDLSRL
jgi:hypothetical protein